MGHSAVEACISAGGECRTVRDGYYIVNSFCIITGIILAITVTLPIVKKLERMPAVLWRIRE
jgi:hypothetical protein